MSDISQLHTRPIGPGHNGVTAAGGPKTPGKGAAVMNFLDLLFTQIVAMQDPSMSTGTGDAGKAPAPAAAPINPANIEEGSTLQETISPFPSELPGAITPGPEEANLDEATVQETAPASYPEPLKTPAPVIASASVEGTTVQEAISAFRLALLTPQTQGEIVSQAPSAEKIKVLEKKINVLQKIFDHLTEGLPAEAKDNDAIKSLLTRLETKIDTLQVKLTQLKTGQGADAPFQALISMGLTPAQITGLIQRMEKIESKLGRELTAEDIIAGVGTILPAPAAAPTLNTAIPDEAGEMAKDGSFDPEKILVSRLNDIAVGEEDIKNRDRINVPDLSQMTSMIAKKSDQARPGGFSPLLNLNGATEADVTVPKGWYQTFFEGLDWPAMQGLQSGMPLSQTAQAAHMTTQMQNAGHAHPATQMVAASLNKAAQEGADKSMTLHLDPPELGRVDVRLEFGPDKTIKAHMVVEKPETYLMLQRDAFVLERALQGAGLEAGGSSLSFHLAQDNGAFDRQMNGDGGEGNRYGGTGAGEPVEDVETTALSWYVDPETGYQRYDLFV